jgi:hypothetical protein
LTHVIQQGNNIKIQREPQRQPQCPGSCHVHVEYYRSAFGDKEEENVSRPDPIKQGELRINPQEWELLKEWLRSTDPRQQASTKLYGEYIKSDVAQEYQKHREEFESKPNRKAKVVMFAVPTNECDPDWSKLKASEVSAQQKEKTFKSLGIKRFLGLLFNCLYRLTFKVM